MGQKLYKEPFTGKYDGVTPATMLPPGAVSGGRNMRKVSPLGGWKARKGVALHNSSAISSNPIDSLHKYVNPKNADYHFITQSNSLLYDATKDPPASGTTFGTSLGVSVGTTPGFSAKVNEYWAYADGSGKPIIYGGDTPYPIGFVVYDASEGAFNDYTRKVIDKRSDTGGVILAASADKFYLITNERASGATLTLGSSKNTTTSRTLTVKAWRSGAYAPVSGLSDGTANGTATLGQTGTVSWTASALDEMNVQANIQGYIYEFSWSAALSDSVDVVSITATVAASAITNKWSGIYQWVTGARFYDQSAVEYQEALGKLTNESTSLYLDISEATTSDYLYVKTPEPATGFGIGVVVGFTNTDAALIDLIEHWDGDAFTTVGTLSDSTLDSDEDTSLSQTGIIFFDGSALSPQKRTFQGDNIAGYWYRISWAASLSTTVRLYLAVYAAFPETLPTYNGCIEFKGRLVLWGDPEFPNRLRVSAYDRPDVFSGTDSVYTDPFGDGTKILACALFYGELVVFKEDGIFLLEGYSPATFGVLPWAKDTGLASIQSIVSVETGYSGMSTEEPLSVVIWADTDGIYVLDGRKPKKISLPIDHYFNPEYTTAIPATSITSLQAFADKTNNEYHLLLPSVELVYNYITEEWYPPWEREIPLTCGLSTRGTDGRYYTYGGSSDGLVMRLEVDTTDKTTSNLDQRIDHRILSRAISVIQDKATILKFTLSGLWAELKARARGEVSVTAFKNMSTLGEYLTSPKKLSMIAGEASLVTPHLDMHVENCSVFQIEFSVSDFDMEMEIWSFLYMLEAKGLLDK